MVLGLGRLICHTACFGRKARVSATGISLPLPFFHFSFTIPKAKVTDSGRQYGDTYPPNLFHRPERKLTCYATSHLQINLNLFQFMHSVLP